MSRKTNASKSTSHDMINSQKIGKIKRIYCKNFITYQECTLDAADYLNIIIGPNGTGKSTIVSAIVLCLGGEPATLYRAADIREYIKNGKTEATIAVQIYCATQKSLGILEFSRCFDTTGKSVYKINKEHVSKKKYLETIAEYKIQVTNLCQFLPQDRVQDFAKMNPKEIFENTVKSVCKDEDIKKFNDLKDLYKEQQNKGKNLENVTKNLKDAKQRLIELEKAVGRYNIRNEFEEKIKISRAKKLWLDVDLQKEKLNEINENLKPALKKLQEAKSEYEEEMKNEQKIREDLEELNQVAKNKSLKMKRLEDKVRDCQKRFEESKQELHQAKIIFQREEKEGDVLQLELQNELRLLEACTQDLKNAETKYKNDNIEENYKNFETKMSEKKAEIARLVKERGEINNRLDEEYNPKIQMLKRRLEKLENIRESKLTSLREKFPDVYAAVNWLKDNRHLFQGHVYDPMILELNVIDENNAKYFENTINYRDFLAFTCEYKSDVSKLTDELCIKKKLAINVGYSPPATEFSYKSDEPIRNLQKFGFHSYLIDLIDGPIVPLNYLCSIYNLHKIPVGSEDVSKNSDHIPTHIRQYYGGSQRFTVTISKYTKEPSIMQTAIASKNILQSIDTQQVEYIQHELNSLVRKSDHLKNERSKIEAQITEIEYAYKEVRQEKYLLEHQRANLIQLKQKLNKQIQKLERLRSQIAEKKNLKDNFKDNVNSLLEKKRKILESKVNELSCYETAVWEYKAALIKINIFKTQNHNLMERVNIAKCEKEKAEKLVQTINNNRDTIKQKYSNMLQEALASTQGQNPNSRSFKYKEEFEQLTNDVNELRELINEFIGRLECMENVDQDIIEEYEAKKLHVETLSNSIKESKQNETTCLIKMKELYSSWYPIIARIVESVNREYSKFMSALKYVGEVVLIRQSEMDFDSYGIQIMVKYREKEKLQPLDRSRQSGGERAVAIAVYSLALQHLTHVPFRCVDEINQGMDARNERKICEMLIEETTKDGMSQYFFVTPKLLNGLSSNERVAVHTVFNCQVIKKDNAFRVNLS